MFQQDGGETLNTDDLLGNLKQVRGSTKYVNKSVNTIIDSLNTDSYSENDLNKELNIFQKNYGDENLDVLKSIIELNENPIAQKGLELRKYQEAGEKHPNWFNKRLYNSVTPIGYDPNQAIKELIAGERLPFEWDGQPQTWETFGNNLDMSPEQSDYIRNASEDAWGTYLGFPQKYDTFKESTFKPSIGDDDDEYVSFNYDDDIWDHALIFNTFNEDFNEENPNGKVIEDTGAGGFTLNNYTLDKGYDEDLDLPYISYFDKFDFDVPMMGTTIEGERIAGKPFNIYGRMYYDPDVVDENGRPERIFEEEFDKIGVNKNLLKANAIDAQLDEFVKDIKGQNEMFDKKFDGTFDEDKKGLKQLSKDIYYEFRNQTDLPYSQTEIAGLINFLGEENTRKFLENVHRDGFSLEEAFPNLYGKDIKNKIKTPSEYIDEFRYIEKDYKKAKSFEHHLLNTLPPNIANQFLNKYSKEELEQKAFNGELEGKAHRKRKRLRNDYKKHIAGEPISDTVKNELVKLGMIDMTEDLNNKNLLKERKGVRQNTDGSHSTHLMKREYIPNRGWVAFPSLFQNEDGEWMDMSEQAKENWRPVYEEAKKRGEVYGFGEDEKAAIEFADKGSWKTKDKKYIKSRSKPTAKDVYEYIKTGNPNISENQIAGIVANIEHESNFRPGVMGDKGTSGGLFQHHKSRLEKMKNFIGKDWDTNWQKQIDYAMTERSMDKYLKKKYKTPTEAVAGFMRIFERPKDQSDENVLDRSQYLNKYDFDGDGTPIGRDDTYTSRS